MPPGSPDSFYYPQALPSFAFSPEVLVLPASTGGLQVTPDLPAAGVPSPAWAVTIPAGTPASAPKVSIDAHTGQLTFATGPAVTPPIAYPYDVTLTSGGNTAKARIWLNVK